jgi:hypothetical protein
MFILSYNSLGDVDKEVSDLLELGKNVHVIYTCKVVVAVALDVDDVLLAEVVAALVDVILTVLSIRDVAKILVLEVLDHHVIRLDDQVTHLVQTVKDSLVEYLSVCLLSLEDTSYRLS